MLIPLKSSTQNKIRKQYFKEAYILIFVLRSYLKNVVEREYFLRKFVKLSHILSISCKF